MLELETYVVAAKTITLVCGGLVTWFAFRAYRRTGSPALRALTAGLGLVTAGALVAGVLDRVIGVDLAVGVGVQSTFTAIGFAVLAYSLYVEEPRESPHDVPEPLPRSQRD